MIRRPTFCSLLLVLAACDRAPPAPPASPPEATTSAAENTGNRKGPDDVPVLPLQFQGTFDRTLADCSASSVYRLTVGPRTLQFHESRGQVREVIVESDLAIRVTSDFSGEGETWTATRQIELSSDRQRLTIAGDEIPSSSRVRCPTGDARGSRWEHVASGEGDGLGLWRAETRLLTLFCPADREELIVNVPGFRPIGSEERMSLGAGGEVVTLVADPAGDRQRGGVSAAGPVPANLAAILAGSAPIAVNYGAQDEGPHPLPDREAASSLIAGCRD